jgi:hypothetical protein
LKIKASNIKISLIIAGVTGAIIITFITFHFGAGISPDSVYYFSVARNLSEGKGFVGYDGNYYVLQPPFYPLLLAVIEKFFSIAPVISAGYINAILFGLIVFCSGLFLSEKLNSSLLILLGALLVLVSSVIFQISLIALSEPLFILFVILFFYSFDTYKKKNDIKSLIFFSLTAVLAVLTRYIGIVLILTGIISISFFDGGKLKYKFKHSLIFLVVTSFPIGLWIFRNYVLSRTLVGPRAVSSYSIIQNLSFFFNTIINWFIVLNLTEHQVFFLCVILVSFLLMGIILFSKTKRRILPEPMYPVFVFIFLYSAAIIISSSTTAYDKISDRLLSPIFVPLLSILLMVVDYLSKWLSKYFNKKFLSFLFLLGILFWIKYPIENTTKNIEIFIRQEGWGYNSIEWKNNSLADFLSKNKNFENGYTFYSNVPEAVYLFSNKETKWTPAKTFYNSPKLINPEPYLQKLVEGNKICIIWFTNAHRKFLFTIEELQKIIPMKKIVHLKDGDIYNIVE